MSLGNAANREGPHPYADFYIGERWKEIQGENHWRGLLDPMDPVLRGELVRYGEFAQAAYDAFDHNDHSTYFGSCRYGKQRLLQRVGLGNRGYTITDFLYATTSGQHPVAQIVRRISKDKTDNFDPDEMWDAESSWMGYVAVCTDKNEIARLGRQDILIVWRGTVTKLEGYADFRDRLVPHAADPRTTNNWGHSEVRIELGFLSMYTSKNLLSEYTKKSARHQVLEALQRLVNKYKHEEQLSITLVGHSLGSALATLCAYDIAQSGMNHRESNPVPVSWEQPGKNAPKSHNVNPKGVNTIPVTVFSYGGPRVGNDAFRDQVEKLNINILRAVNTNDIVPKVPGVFTNEKWSFFKWLITPLWKFVDWWPWTYSHVGVELKVDRAWSPYLKKDDSYLVNHNLEGYLHLLGGYHGSNLDFQPALDRDIALVNKGNDFLVRKLKVPKKWYQEENKGLCRNEGRWVLRAREADDVPQYYLDTLDADGDGKADGDSDLLPKHVLELFDS